MTTRAEIKRWVRPLLEWRSDLSLEGHLLVLRPIQHVMRGIYFRSSRSKQYPTVGWFLIPLFGLPSKSLGFNFLNDIAVGATDQPDFQEVFESRTRHFIEHVLTPITTIEKFRGHLLSPKSWEEGKSFGPRLDTMGRLYGPVLAALGQISEAREAVRSALAWEEPFILSELEAGRRLIVKNARSAVGRVRLSFAEANLPTVANLKALLAVLEMEDRPAIAALLHEWERAEVSKWKVEHLWEPTPFPLELSQ